MRKARRLLYSIPIGLLVLVTLLVALPAGAVTTATVTLTVQNTAGLDGATGTTATDADNLKQAFVSTNSNALTGSDLVFIAVNDADRIADGDGEADTPSPGETVTIKVVSSSVPGGVDVLIRETSTLDGGVAGANDLGILRGQFQISGRPTATAGTVKTAQSLGVGDATKTVFSIPDGRIDPATLEVKVADVVVVPTAITGAATARPTVTLGTAPALGATVTATYTLTVAQIQVGDGDTVTARYSDATTTFGTQVVTKAVTVDNVQPAITGFTPAHKSSFTVAAGTSTTMQVTATDSRSGFVPEDTAVTGNEVLNNARFTVNASSGAPLNASLDASGALTASVGVSLGEGEHTWTVTVTDRAGNTRVLDAESETTGNQPAKFSIDTTKPVLLSARTGDRWDSSQNKIVQDRKAVRVEFTESNGLDPASIAPTDFRVDDATPTSAQVFSNFVSAGPDAILGNADDVTTVLQSSVFLGLADALAPNAKPVVRLSSTVSDKAGNTSETKEVTAADGIQPGLTVTVAGDKDNRTVAKSSLTVTVASDEALQQPPAINAAKLQRAATGVGPDTVAGTADDVLGGVNVLAATGGTVNAVSGQTNTWSAAFSRSALGDGLVNFHVTATDTSSNTATKGVTGSNVDLAKAIMAEFDSQLNGNGSPTFELNPTAGGVVTQTDAVRPFIRIKFTAEGAEYPIPASTGTGIPTTASFPSGSAAPNSSDSTIKVDTHPTITISKALFGVKGQTGADVKAQVQRTGDNEFLFLPAADLVVGTDYTLTLNASDDVGNVSITGSTTPTDFALTFKVVAPTAFKVDVVPGFNLMSFPDNPQKQGINDVFGGNPGIKQVLTYDPSDATGPWLISQRGTDGKFGTGQIVNIVAGRAYWIEATTFETVSVVIPRRGVSTENNRLQPPQVNVVLGWNLAGVINTANLTPGTLIDADTYFGTISWLFAYTFDTATGSWQRITKAVNPNDVMVGKGYWVFTDKAGLLVP